MNKAANVSPRRCVGSVSMKVWYWMAVWALYCCCCNGLLPEAGSRLRNLRRHSRSQSPLALSVSTTNEGTILGKSKNLHEFSRQERDSKYYAPKRSRLEKSRPDRKFNSRADSQGSAMLNHGILTLKEEQRLGEKIERAIQVKELMTTIVEEKHAQSFERSIIEKEYTRQVTADLGFPSKLDLDALEDYDDDESLEGLSVYDVNIAQSRDGRMNRQLHVDEEYPKDQVSNGSFDWYEKTNLEGSVGFTDDDIIEKLGIEGGQEELTRILIDGAVAREKLISSNVRLVLSIAKKWIHKSASISGEANDHRLSILYGGSWTRPSLDEAVQEGILGLATAADRYDYKRKLRFGTYATYWITNSIRKCFQRASTGCLRVPTNYYQIRQRYQKIVKQHYEETGNGKSVDAAATELGLTMQRLEFILKSTEPLLSMDAPRPTSGVHTQAGKAGAQENSPNSQLLGDSLSCTDPMPEEQVELSLLRQCLENAMATELSPHERDVLRLRHGLDDGNSRSFREVVEILGASLSVSDVRQAENSAFRKLRSPVSVHTYHLFSFLDLIDINPTTTKGYLR